MKDQDRDLDVVARAQQNPGKASEPLRVAITIGDLCICKQIVEQGVDLDAGYRDCNGCTPLLYSLQQGQKDIAEYLALEGAAPVDKICHDFNPVGYSVFHLAARYNHLELLRILLERHTNQYLQLTDPIHPTHLAIISQATECIFLMISHIGRESISTSTTPLQYGKCYAHCLANLRVGVLDASFNSRVPKSGDTPLILAAKAKNPNIATLLLEVGSLVDEEDLNHQTPLHHAASKGDTEMVELLLEHGANPQAQNKALETPAMLAAGSGHLEVLQALIKGGADLQILDFKRWNALYHALFCSRAEAFLYLIAATNGYDLEQKTLFGESALEGALRLCECNMQTLLPNMAPSPGAYYPGKFNIVTGAVLNPRTTVAVMKMLLRRIPQEVLPMLLTHRSVYGGTPLYTACTLTTTVQQSAIITLLLDAGAELETEGGDHGTPLLGACAAGRLQIVKLLTRKGAKMLYRNQHGRIVSALRAAKYFPEIVHWLLVGRFTEGPRLIADGGGNRT